LDELAGLVLFNNHRRAQWLQLMGFLAWPVMNRRFSYAYIGGGFLSAKAHPQDVDVVLETTAPYGPQAFTTVSRFFAAGLDQIQDIYGVHLQFWMKGAPPGLSDFRTFFQYQRPEEKRGGINRSRGIVRLQLSNREAMAEVRRQLRGASEEEAARPRRTRGLAGMPLNTGSLSVAKRHLATLGQHSRQLIMILDPTGRVEWANDAFLSCTGHVFDEIVGREPGAFLLGPSPDLHVVDKLTNALRDGQDCDCIFVNHRKDGRAYLAETALRAIYHGKRLDGFYSIQENLGAVPTKLTAVQAQLQQHAAA
jgi:PAS domain S-box-containing protein